MKAHVRLDSIEIEAEDELESDLLDSWKGKYMRLLQMHTGNFTGYAGPPGIRSIKIGFVENTASPTAS
jgi:hypothetical protein